MKARNVVIYLGLLAVVIILLRDPLSDVLSATGRLSQIAPSGYFLMFLFELLSFTCLWLLFRIVLPRVRLYTIAMSQLISNAASRAIPGGMATGGAVQYKILADAGVKGAEAGGALAATSVLTTMVLLAIPALAGAVAFFGASLENTMETPILIGVGLLAMIGAFGFVCVKSDKPLSGLARGMDWVVGKIYRLFGKGWVPDHTRLLVERDRLLGVLRGSWGPALLTSAGKWVCDCLVLYVALREVGADPSWSLFLLAYAGASVLVMVPITPGGFGIVEVGLTSMLVSAGVDTSQATLAVLAYRIVSFWFPLIVGAAAGVIYRFRR